MYSLVRIFISWLTLVSANFIILCLGMFEMQVFAQDESQFTTFQPSSKFQGDLGNFGNLIYGSHVDHATLWGSAGSSWVLKDKLEHNLPYLERFKWKGSKIEFLTPPCSPDDNHKNPNHLTGEIKFTQKYKSGISLRTQKVMLFSAMGTLGHPKKLLQDNCPAAFKALDLHGSVIGFQAHGRKTDTVEITVTIDDDETGKPSTFRLTYEPDPSFHPLTQAAWQLRPDNGAPAEVCGPVSFSIAGKGTAGCCNFLSFDFDKNKSSEGWSVAGYEMTLRACQGDRGKADFQIQQALSKGLILNDEGHLVAGPKSEVPYIFEPVTGYEKLEGTWLLSGLESRVFDDRIWTMPRTHRVKDEVALKALDIKLNVESDQLAIYADCREMAAKIRKQKTGFLRLERGYWSEHENCKAKDKVGRNALWKLFYVVGVVGSNTNSHLTTLKVDYDEREEKLTLTRATIGTRATSHSWTFTRVN